MDLIGIDIGGTKCAVVSGDESCTVKRKIKIETTTKEQTLSRIYSAAASLGHADFIGISCGGPLDEERGVIKSPPNLPGWDDVHICEELSRVTGAGCAIKNDADACAIAEWQSGAGKGCDNMVFLTFGTGMGAGLILNGAPYRGKSGNAGEVGHIRLSSRGPVGYRKAGSFEGFCSGGGIKRQGQAEAEKMFSLGLPGPAYCPTPDDLPAVSAKLIAECARGGDRTAKLIFDRVGRRLGEGIAIIIYTLDPESVVIGGIYPRCADLLGDKIAEYVKKEALPGAAEGCRILPSYYKDSIGDVAALSVALYEAKKRGFSVKV